MWRFAPTDRGYAAASYSPHADKFDHLALHAAAGYVFVQGRDHTGGLAFDARLLRVTSDGLVDVSLDGFFRKYYHSAPAGYAQPAGYNSPEVMGDVQVVKAGGKTYLMYSTVGLGDVYEVADSGAAVDPPVDPPGPPDPPNPPVDPPTKCQCTCTCPCPCAGTSQDVRFLDDQLSTTDSVVWSWPSENR